MHRILVSDKLGQPGIHQLEQEQSCKYEVNLDLTQEQLIKVIPSYDALIIRSGTQVTESVLKAGKNLKVVGRAGIGVDNVDVKAASQAGVIVMNTPQANSVATAEHTFTSLLAVCRHTAPAHASLLAGEWSRSLFTGTQLYKKTLGLIGFGRIARLVAQRAKAFEMRVVAYDPYVSAEVGQEVGVELLDLEELLSMADMVSLHTGMSAETENIVNADSLKKMKDGVIIVNPSRGKLVDEFALAEAIRSGKVKGAALDVYRSEPPDASHPLIGLPGVLHTPHLGASTEEAQRDVAQQIVSQVVDALNERDFKNSVNMPFSAGPNFSEIEPFMSLASKIGALQFHMADSPIRKIELEIKGDALEGLAKPVATGLLKGLLENVSSEVVNYINAPEVAHELGIEVSQSIGLSGSDYANLMSCRVEWEGGQRTISGTLLGGEHPRIVEVSSYRIDVEPQGNMLIMMNKDVPGVIGEVGTLLGKHGVNIAEWRLGRSEKGDHALAMINLDSDLTDRTLSEIRALPAILKVLLVKL